jgi:hypothetical protein
MSLWIAVIADVLGEATVDTGRGTFLGVVEEGSELLDKEGAAAPLFELVVGVLFEFTFPIEFLL